MNKISENQQIILNEKLEEKINICNIAEDISSKLYTLMSERNLSNKALGTIAGISDMTIHRILKEKQNVSIEKLFRLCLAMDIKLSEFFEGIGYDNPELD